MVRFNEREKKRCPPSVRYSHILGITTVILLLILFFFGEGNSDGDDGISYHKTVIIPQDDAFGNTLLFSTDLMEKGSANIWKQICKEGGKLARENNQASGTSSPVVAMEVGMFDYDQCYFAAYVGMHAHCVEPSPMNYKRVVDQIDSSSKNHTSSKVSAALERISTYNMAAGNATGATIPFFGNGGTGDHIGEFDAWNMVKGLGKEKDYPDHKKSKRTDVSMVKIDDIIRNRITPTSRKENDPSNPKIQDVFALKIDTQGFEPAVFSGLIESIEMKKIHFILFEYWPKGMDLLSNSDTKCAESVAILKQLDAAKYKLYALRVVAHTATGMKAINAMNEPDAGRPFDSFEANCNWYYEFEKRFPNANYKMGYWSDILAVSPDAKLSDPITNIGKILAKNL